MRIDYLRGNNLPMDRELQALQLLHFISEYIIYYNLFKAIRIYIGLARWYWDINVPNTCTGRYLHSKKICWNWKLLFVEIENCR